METDTTPTTEPAPRGRPGHGDRVHRGHPPSHEGEEGSVVSEYGLVAALGATLVGLVISWMKGGAVASLLAALLQQLRAVIAA